MVKDRGDSGGGHGEAYGNARLAEARENGKKPVKQIVFAGERFNVMSVPRWRGKVLKEQMK